MSTILQIIGAVLGIFGLVWFFVLDGNAHPPMWMIAAGIAALIIGAIAD